MLTLLLGNGAPIVAWMIVACFTGFAILLRLTLGGVAKVKLANAREIEERGKIEIALARLRGSAEKIPSPKRIYAK